MSLKNMHFEPYEYNELIRPINLFKSTEELVKFLEIPAEKQALINMLQLCEADELFEWCNLIKNKIDNYK